MFSLETLDIDLKAMKEESQEASYMLDDEYFKSLDDAQIQKGNVSVTMAIRKASEDNFTLTMRVEGVVTVQCDRCLDDMEQPIEASDTCYVRIGHDNPEEDDDTITVDENEGILRPAWLIYELIALAIPIKHVHAPGKCNDAMTQKLEELSATRSGDEDAEEAIDPRWAKLIKLKK